MLLSLNCMEPFILFSIFLYIFVGGCSDFLLTCEVYIFSIYKPSFEILPTRKVICIHVFDILIANTYFQDISHYMGGLLYSQGVWEGRQVIYILLPPNQLPISPSISSNHTPIMSGDNHPTAPMKKKNLVTHKVCPFNFPPGPI